MVLAPRLTVDLKAEVNAAVRPYVNNATIPPFTVAKIAVMAWVCRPNQQQTTITDEETSNWIIMNFWILPKTGAEGVAQSQLPEL
jgi:hypothetical protein